MSFQPGPQGPYGPPPPYGPPRKGGGATTLIAALLSAVFVVATVLAAVHVHHHGSDSSAAAPPAGQYSLGVSAAPVATPTFAVPTYATPTLATPTLTVPTYVPPPAPTHVPLDPEAINRTFEVYMDALAYHNLSTLKTATCPRLRSSETGTALHGKYVGRWKGNDYTIYSTQDYVTLSATIHLITPSTGRAANTVTYRWNVERDTTGHYYVCGFLS